LAIDRVKAIANPICADLAGLLLINIQVDRDAALIDDVNRFETAGKVAGGQETASP
jgi:hypothetical protein